MELTQDQIQEEAQKMEISTEEYTSLATQAGEAGKTVEELVEQQNEEAAAEAEELNPLLEKYKNDPKALAKALRSSQQGVTKKIQAEVDKAREAEMRARVAEERLKEKESAAKTQNKQKVMEILREQFPDVDEETLKAMHEIAEMRTNYAVNQLHSAYANDRVEDDLNRLKDEKYYDRFKDEVDKRVRELPFQQKSQKGIAKRIYDYVVGQHAQELIEEAGSKKAPENPNKRIVGNIKPPKGKASAIGGKEESLLPQQKEEMARFGLTKIESYLVLLNKRKEQAKKNGKPEPTLVSESIT